MSGAHTPGPWSITSAGFDETCDSNDACYYIAADGGMEVSKANARLIAAAPDMLWAIEAALEMLIDSWGDEQIAAGDDQVANLLRAAIAKAKGE